MVSCCPGEKRKKKPSWNEKKNLAVQLEHQEVSKPLSQDANDSYLVNAASISLSATVCVFVCVTALFRDLCGTERN